MGNSINAHGDAVITRVNEKSEEVAETLKNAGDAFLVELDKHENQVVSRLEHSIEILNEIVTDKGATLVENLQTFADKISETVNERW